MASILTDSTAAPTERLITSLDGAKIFAQAVGDSRLPPLVFIHGFSLSSLVWASALRNVDLLRNFHLIAYDVRGHGRSSKPEDPAQYSSKHYAEDFISVTKAFNTTRAPILVGWSMGGSIASDVIEHYPEALAGLVYVGAVPFIGSQLSVGTEWALSHLPPMFNLDNTSIGISSRIDFTNALFKDPEQVPVEILWSWLGSTLMLEPAKAMIVASREQNPTKLFEAGTRGLPLLVLDGDADKFILGDEVYKIVDGKFTDLTRHTTKDGSHVFFYEEEEVFVENVVKFAKRVFGSSQP